MRVAAIAVVAACSAKPTHPKPPPLRTLPGIAVTQAHNHVMHGGTYDAPLEDASVGFTVTDRRIHRVRVTKLELVIAECEGKKTVFTRESLALTGYKLFDGKSRDPISESKTQLELPATPGAYTIDAVIGTKRSVWQGNCHSFAFELLVDEVPVAVEVELDVEREEDE